MRNCQNDELRVSYTNYFQPGTAPRATDNLAMNQQKRNSGSLQIVLDFADFSEFRSSFHSV